MPRGLGAMVVTTLLLMAGVGVGTLVVGGGLAWLVTAYRFPLRNVLVWLLVLPLAMPAYILGFVFLSTFDAAGPVQSALRTVFGDGLVLPSVRSLPGAVLVMSLSLFPYVYLMARAALVEQSPSTYDAARTLGAGRARAFWRVLLPLARPSLAAGLALVMMETLTDFATVQYFGVKTVSVGVYLVWKGSYNFHAATQLSVLVLLFAVAVLAGERLMRGRARYTQRGGRGQGLQARELTGWRGWGAAALCLLALGVGFFVPVGRLVAWAVSEARRRPCLVRRPALRRVPRQQPRRRRHRGHRLRAAVAADEPRHPDRRRARGAHRRAADHLRLRRPGRGRRHRRAADLRGGGHGAGVGRRPRRHRPARDRLRARHPLRLPRAVPRAGVPGRRRQLQQDRPEHDAVGDEPRRRTDEGAAPGAPAAGASRCRGRAGAGHDRRDQGAAHRAAAAAVRVHYRVRVGLPARRRELLGEGCAAGTRDRRRGRGPGVLPLPSDPGHRPAPRRGGSAS